MFCRPHGTLIMDIIRQKVPEAIHVTHYALQNLCICEGAEENVLINELHKFLFLN